MPIDSALVAARLGKPGDLRHSVTDRDQKHPTALAATQANTRDLAKGHVDHAAHSQPVLVRLTVFHHGRGSLLTSSRTYNHWLMILEFLLNSFRKMATSVLDPEAEFVLFCCGALRRDWHKADIPKQARHVRFEG